MLHDPMTLAQIGTKYAMFHGNKSSKMASTQEWEKLSKQSFI